MKIVVGSDHGGYLYKEEIKKFLNAKNIEVIDVGTNSTDSSNYAQYAIEAAKKVSTNEADLGILVCTSGEGVCIAANKVHGVRCGLGYNDDVSQLMKEHNNANMIAFGAKFMSLEDVLHRIDLFLNAKFEGDRHAERVKTIDNYKD